MDCFRSAGVGQLCKAVAASCACRGWGPFGTPEKARAASACSDRCLGSCAEGGSTWHFEAEQAISPRLRCRELSPCAALDLRSMWPASEELRNPSVEITSVSLCGDSLLLVG